MSSALHSLSIGRSSRCDIRLNDHAISRYHADLKLYSDGSIYIEDRGSTNGTFVNGKRVDRHRLQAGDRLFLASRIPLEWMAYRRQLQEAGSAPSHPAGHGSSPMRLSGPARLLAGVLLLLAVYFGSQFYQFATAAQQYRTDAAELQKIRFGMLNPAEWKKKIAIVLRTEIRNFDLSAEDRSEVRAKIEEVLYDLIDQVEEIFLQNQNQGSSLLDEFIDLARSFIADVIIDIDNLRQNVPRIANTIMEHIENRESRDQIADWIEARINRFIDNVTDRDDLEQIRREICIPYPPDSPDACLTYLLRNESESQQAAHRSAWVLVLIAILFSMLYSYQSRRDPLFHFLAIPLLLLLLFAGVSTPMIDIDARISSVRFQLLNSEINFGEQILFFKSKSILDVVQLLMGSSRGSSILVGGLVLLFSVLFPVVKIIALMIDQTQNRSRSLVRFLAYKTGKWSMADVMVVAILMAYIGINNIVDSQLGQLSAVSDRVDVLTTNHTELQPGLLLFLLFCLCSIAFAGLAARRKSAPDA